MPTYRTVSEEETIALGERLASTLAPRAAVLLIGNLGAGKTTLAKGIVKGLGAAEAEEVSSPTYTLVHEYRGPQTLVYHVDLYRLDDPRQVEGLGLDDLFDSAVVLVEWGERFRGLMPPARTEILLEHAGGEAREIHVNEIHP